MKYEKGTEEVKVKKNIRTGIIIFIWIILWQLAALAIGRPIFFVGPVEVCQALFQQILVVCPLHQGGKLRRPGIQASDLGG